MTVKQFAKCVPQLFELPVRKTEGFFWHLQEISQRPKPMFGEILVFKRPVTTAPQAPDPYAHSLMRQQEAALWTALR